MLNLAREAGEQSHFSADDSERLSSETVERIAAEVRKRHTAARKPKVDRVAELFKRENAERNNIMVNRNALMIIFKKELRKTQEKYYYLNKEKIDNIVGTPTTLWETTTGRRFAKQGGCSKPTSTSGFDNSACISDDSSWGIDLEDKNGLLSDEQLVRVLLRGGSGHAAELRQQQWNEFEQMSRSLRREIQEKTEALEQVMKNVTSDVVASEISCQPGERVVLPTQNELQEDIARAQKALEALEPPFVTSKRNKNTAKPENSCSQECQNCAQCEQSSCNHVQHSEDSQSGGVNGNERQVPRKGRLMTTYSLLNSRHSKGCLRQVPKREQKDIASQNVESILEREEIERRIKLRGDEEELRRADAIAFNNWCATIAEKQVQAAAVEKHISDTKTLLPEVEGQKRETIQKNEDEDFQKILAKVDV